MTEPSFKMMSRGRRFITTFFWMKWPPSMRSNRVKLVGLSVSPQNYLSLVLLILQICNFHLYGNLGNHMMAGNTHVLHQGKILKEFEAESTSSGAPARKMGSTGRKVSNID